MSAERIGSGTLEVIVSLLSEEDRLRLVPETYLAINGSDTASRVAIENQLFLTYKGTVMGLLSSEGDVSKWGDLEGGCEYVICVNERHSLFSREELEDIVT